MSVDLETVASHIGKITYDFPYIPLTATKLKKMRDRSYSRAISNMNSDSGSEEIVRNGTNRSVFHKKGMSFILRIHMIQVTYQMNSISNFILTQPENKNNGWCIKNQPYDENAFNKNLTYFCHLCINTAHALSLKAYF